MSSNQTIKTGKEKSFKIINVVVFESVIYRFITLFKCDELDEMCRVLSSELLSFLAWFTRSLQILLNFLTS